MANRITWLADHTKYPGMPDGYTIRNKDGFPIGLSHNSQYSGSNIIVLTTTNVKFNVNSLAVAESNSVKLQALIDALPDSGGCIGIPHDLVLTTIRLPTRTIGGIAGQPINFRLFGTRPGVQIYGMSEKPLFTLAAGTNGATHTPTGTALCELIDLSIACRGIGVDVTNAGPYFRAHNVEILSEKGPSWYFKNCDGMHLGRVGAINGHNVTGFKFENCDHIKTDYLWSVDNKIGVEVNGTEKRCSNFFGSWDIKYNTGRQVIFNNVHKSNIGIRSEGQRGISLAACSELNFTGDFHFDEVDENTKLMCPSIFEVQLNRIPYTGEPFASFDQAPVVIKSHNSWSYDIASEMGHWVDVAPGLSAYPTKDKVMDVRWRAKGSAPGEFLGHLLWSSGGKTWQSIPILVSNEWREYTLERGAAPSDDARLLFVGEANSHIDFELLHVAEVSKCTDYCVSKPTIWILPMIKCYAISNVGSSLFSLSIPYNIGDRFRSATDIHFSKSGTLKLSSNKTVEIEAFRIEQFTFDNLQSDENVRISIFERQAVADTSAYSKPIVIPGQEFEITIPNYFSNSNIKLANINDGETVILELLEQNGDGIFNIINHRFSYQPINNGTHEVLIRAVKIFGSYRIEGDYEVVTLIANSYLTHLVSDDYQYRVSSALTWPITMGVPFAKGFISSNTACVALNDVSQPTQCKEAISWDDGTVKFLTMDFQTNVSELNNSKILLYNAPVTHPNPVVVVDNVGSLDISNGVISFSISKTSFKGIENLVHNGQQIINNSDFYWVNHNDESYKAENFLTPELEVETEGPLRTVIKAEGFFKYGSDESMKYRVRFHVFAGLPYVKTDFTWIWTEDHYSNVMCTFTSSGTPSLNKVKLNPCYGMSGFTTATWANGQAVKFGKITADTMPTNINTSTVYYVRNTGYESLACGGGSPINMATFTVHPTANDAISDTNHIAFGTNGTGIFWINAHTPYIKDIGLKLNTGFTSIKTNIGVDGNVSEYIGQVGAVQRAFGDVEIYHDFGSDPLDFIEGWAEVTNGTIGLACSIRDMKYESTKEFIGDATYLSAHIIAPDAPSFNWSWQELIHDQVINSATIEHSSFAVPNPSGVAKTTEIWIWPTTVATDNAGINDLIQNPPCVITNPVYNCDTNVITNIRPASETPAELQFIEDALETAIIYAYLPSYLEGELADPQNMTMIDYGDVHLYRSGLWRSWDNNGHGSGRAALTQFYRTGKRIYKYMGEIFHKHWVDVDVVNYGEYPGNVYTVPKTLGWTHLYSSLHWAAGPLFLNFNSHKESLVWAIGLIGHERFSDSMQDQIAGNEYLVAGGTLLPQNLAQVSRGQYGCIEPFTAFYMYSNNPAHLDGSFSWFDWMDQAATFTEIDYVIYNQQGQPIVPNNNFWYFYAIGLRNLYNYLEDEIKKERVKNLILKVTADYTTQHSNHDDPIHYVRYYSSTYPHEIWYQLGQRDMVTPYTFSYELTGNVNYLRNPIKEVVNFALATDETGIASSNFENVNHEIQDTLLTLGVWANENFRLDLMFGGGNLRNANIATSVNSPFTYVATYHFRKTDGVPGFIRIYCDTTTAQTTHMSYRITKPDLSTVEVQMSTGSPPTCYITPKYEIDITNIDFDGYDQTFGEFKLEILTQFATYFVVQSDMPKFVINNPVFYNQITSSMMAFPADASGTYYMKVKAGQATIDITNDGGDKIIISEEDVNLVIDEDVVPTSISNVIFNKGNGTETAIAVDDSKILKCLSFLTAITTAGVEPFISAAKGKFFIPWLNISSYFQYLIAKGGVFSDDAATTNSVNDGVVAVWENLSNNVHNRYIQTVNGSRPIYKTSSINGHPALDFTGDKFLHHEGQIYTGQPRGSFFVVFRINAISGTQTIFSSCYNDVSYETFSVFGDGSIRWYMNSGGGGYGSCLSGAGVISANTVYVVTVSANSALDSYIMRINGVEVATTSTFPTGNFGVNNVRFAIGCYIFTTPGIPYGASPQHFNGQIAEYKVLVLHDLNNDAGKVIEEEQKLIDKYLTV